MKNYQKNKGAAITEAVIILPVLLTILYGLYYIWRVSMIISDATVAVRSEMMLHSLLINSDSTLNNENWSYGKSGFSGDAKLYSEKLGVFAGIPADKIKIFNDVQKIGDEIPNVYDVMRSILTDAAIIQVTVPLPEQPFLHGSEQNYTATAICSVNPWALNQKQFFGATLNWLELMGTHPTHPIETDTSLIRQTESIEGLPHE
jgi:hypothetical protein